MTTPTPTPTPARRVSAPAYNLGRPAAFWQAALASPKTTDPVAPSLARQHGAPLISRRQLSRRGIRPRASSRQGGADAAELGGGAAERELVARGRDEVAVHRV
jgi:hypothetical protein